MAQSLQQRAAALRASRARSAQRRSPSIGKQVSRQENHLLRTGSRFQSFDQLRQRHFWSTYLFTADANGYVIAGQSYTLFTTPQGQAGQGFTTQLTDLETNWKGASRVPDNQNIMLTEVGVGLSIVPVGVRSDEAENVIVTGAIAEQFLENSLLGITYLTNTVELGRCSDFAQPSGASMGTFNPQPAAPTVNASRVTTNGFAAPGLRRKFQVPILLGHGETFNFVYIVPRTYSVGTAGYQIYARMDFWATESFVEKS